LLWGGGCEGYKKGDAGMAIGKEFGRETEEGRRGRLMGVAEQIQSRRSRAAVSSSPSFLREVVGQHLHSIVILYVITIRN
jgi:hypothetical protein